MSARVAVTSSLDIDGGGRGLVRRSSLKYALGIDAADESTQQERLDAQTELAQQHSLRAVNSSSGGATAAATSTTATTTTTDGDVDATGLSFQDTERRASLGAEPPRLRTRRSRLQPPPEDIETPSPRVRSEATTVTPSTTVSLTLDLRSMSMRRAQQPSRRSLEDLEDSNRVRRRRSTRQSAAEPSLATTVYSPRSTTVLQPPMRRANRARQCCSVM
ncbi:hypothetical protein PINS_up011686 [Pythium insidiosum]|nr:hypothetical protein PINS_up011686 [Pythium insidiosum]